MYNEYENDYPMSEEELDYIPSEDDEDSARVHARDYYSDFSYID